MLELTRQAPGPYCAMLLCRDGRRLREAGPAGSEIARLRASGVVQ